MMQMPRDARLQRALEAAPDQDQLPASATRAAIQEQARAVLAPGAVSILPPAKWEWGWWEELRRSMGRGRPWNAAFATVLLACFVTLLWHDPPFVPETSPRTGAAISKNGSALDARTPFAASERASDGARATPQLPQPNTAGVARGVAQAPPHAPDAKASSKLDAPSDPRARADALIERRVHDSMQAAGPEQLLEREKAAPTPVPADTPVAGSSLPTPFVAGASRREATLAPLNVQRPSPVVNAQRTQAGTSIDAALGADSAGRISSESIPDWHAWRQVQIKHAGQMQKMERPGAGAALDNILQTIHALPEATPAYALQAGGEKLRMELRDAGGATLAVVQLQPPLVLWQDAQGPPRQLAPSVAQWQALRKALASWNIRWPEDAIK